MSDYVVVSPQDESELDAVYSLFTRSFGLNDPNIKNHFDFLRRTEPYSPLPNYLIVKESNDEIVGAMRLVERKLMFGEVRLKAAGMSLFAVSPDHWIKGVSQAIQQSFFELANRSFDITFGFARKRMDGYWSRFGYIGYTSFTTLSVERKDLPARGKIKSSEFSRQHLSYCQSYFLNNYRHVYGSVYRDAELWDFYLKRLDQDRLGTLISFQASNGQVIGYALINDNRILELAGDQESYEGIAAALCARSTENAHTLEFDLSPAHPFFRFMLRYPHQYTVRRVWKGGHIAKTAPVEKFLTTIRPELEARLREAECSGFSVSINDQIFDWSGAQLEIYTSQSTDPSDIEFNAGEWQKILLGVISPPDVVGFNSRSKQAERVAQILFPVLWPQTPVLDRF